MSKKRSISYRRGVASIALEDEPMIMNAEEMIGYASVHAIAEAFDKTLEQVAGDVIRYRGRESKGIGHE